MQPRLWTHHVFIIINQMHSIYSISMTGTCNLVSFINFSDYIYRLYVLLGDEIIYRIFILFFGDH